MVRTGLAQTMLTWERHAWRLLQQAGGTGGGFHMSYGPSILLASAKDMDSI